MRKFLALLLFSSILSFAGSLQPTKDLAVLNVSATDPKGRAHVQKVIQFKGIHNGKVFEDTTDSRGEFSILIPKGESYTILFMSLSGPYPCGEVNVPLNAGVGGWSVEFDESTYELKEVLFETAKSALKSSSFKQLNLLVEGLQKNDTVKVEIAGHTDNVGDETYNMNLSQARAETVRSYLLAKGIAANRVIAKGYGFSEPVAENDSESGRAKNRRTEVRILNKQD
jgi:outer membrane protein OmpA-like peptidoglycan-associated protein